MSPAATDKKKPAVKDRTTSTAQDLNTNSTSESEAGQEVLKTLDDEFLDELEKSTIQNEKANKKKTADKPTPEDEQWNKLYQEEELQQGVSPSDMGFQDIQEISDRVKKRMYAKQNITIETVPEAEKAPFFIWDADDYDPEPPVWLIEDFLEVDTISEIFGASGTAKTFLCIDLAFCVATGKAFHGREVKQGPVLYILGEGFRGYRQRLEALKIFHGMKGESVQIARSRTPIDIKDPVFMDTVFKLIEVMPEKPVFIIIDTWRTNTSGKENDNDDANEATKVMRQLNRHANNNTSSLLVHHTGKDESRGSRGGSALKGNMDRQYQTSLEQKKYLTVECKKTKETAAMEKMNFELFQVELGFFDKNGRMVESAILKSNDKKVDKNSRAGEFQELGLDILKNLYKQNELNLSSGHIETGVSRISKREWKKECLANNIKERTFYDIVIKLTKKNQIIEDPPYVSLQSD